MRAFTAAMSTSSEEDGPQHGGTLPAPIQGATATMLHIEKGRKLELGDGEIELKKKLCIASCVKFYVFCCGS